MSRESAAWRIDMPPQRHNLTCFAFAAVNQNNLRRVLRRDPSTVFHIWRICPTRRFAFSAAAGAHAVLRAGSRRRRKPGYHWQVGLEKQNGNKYHPMALSEI